MLIFPDLNTSEKLDFGLASDILGWFVTPDKRRAQAIFEEKAGCLAVRTAGSSQQVNIPIRGKLMIEPGVGPNNPLVPWLDRELMGLQQSVDELFLGFGRPFIRKLPWPQGKPFALAISHDVDLTRKFGPKGALLSLLTGEFGKFQKSALELFSRQNRYWTFPELLSFYTEKKFKSTFFFLARSREDRSYRYNINSGKFRKLFRQILASGHEIGLHSSKYAFEKPEKIVKEKQRLENILGSEAKGVRQHFLRLKFPDAWPVFADAGFGYDSSAGFNEKIGFRMGTCFPFTPDNLKNTSMQTFYEVPFVLMDYPWANSRENLNTNGTVLQQLANEILKCQGLLHILWHPSNLAETEFQPFWQELFQWLGNQTFYSDSLENIVDWWDKRRAVRLTRIDRSGGETDFYLNAASSLSELVLEVVSGRKIESIRGVQTIERRGEKKYRLHLEPLRAGENRVTIGI